MMLRDTFLEDKDIKKIKEEILQQQSFTTKEHGMGEVLEMWEGTSWGQWTSTGSVPGCWGQGQVFFSGSQTLFKELKIRNHTDL